MSMYRFTPIMVLAAAGSYAAPATAVVITQNFNLAPDASVKTNVVIGASSSAQYAFSDGESGRLIGANKGDFIGNFVAGATIPSGHSGITNTLLKVTPGSSDQFVQLAFDINGRSQLGVATFAADTTLDSISYNAVPEPAVWLELIAGFALSGTALRVSRRRRHPSAMAR